MILRAGLIAALAASASSAPLQCGHTPEAELQEDETPGDALWRLAQKFHDRHEPAAERQTLQYLVERYPASRWIAPAKEELAKLPGPDADAGG